MKKRFKQAVLFGVIALYSAISQADDVELKIVRVSVDDNVYTPFYAAETERTHNQGSAQRWIRLTVEYKTRGGWIDELVINHLAIVHPYDSEFPIIMAEEVTYMHIGPGRHFSYAYMHPNCVKRYQLRGSRIDAAMEFSRNGEFIASRQTHRSFKEDWAEPGRYELHDGHLLRESETPFQFINYDFKEIIQHQHPVSDP